MGESIYIEDRFQSSLFGQELLDGGGVCLEPQDIEVQDLPMDSQILRVTLTLTEGLLYN